MLSSFLSSSNFLGLRNLCINVGDGLLLFLGGNKVIVGVDLVGRLDHPFFLSSLGFVGLVSSSDLSVSLGNGSSLFSLSLGNSVSSSHISSVDVSLGSVLLLDGDMISVNLLVSCNFLCNLLLSLKLLDLVSGGLVVAAADASAALAWLLIGQFPDVHVIDIVVVVEIGRRLFSQLASAFVRTFAGLATALSVNSVVQVSLQPV